MVNNSLYLINMKFNTHLTREQREFIIEVCYVQTMSLKSILFNSNPNLDVETYCLQEGYNQNTTLENIKRELGWFTEVIIAPTKFLYSSQEDLSVIKHIMVDIFDEPEYDEVKRSLLTKIFTHERIEGSGQIPMFTEN